MENEKTGKVGRRDFLKKGAAGVSLAVLSGCPKKEKAFVTREESDDAAGKPHAPPPELSMPENIPPGQGTLTRMHLDLKRAMKKRTEELRWKMVINTNQCIGCYACEVACISENVSPPGVTLRKVFRVDSGTYPDVTRTFMPSNCMQCNNPPCVKAAPRGGLERRPDGIVALNPLKFKDKAQVDAVIEACPYENAIFYDDGSYFTLDVGAAEGNEGNEGKEGPLQPYEEEINFQYGTDLKRKDLIGRPRKCDFCLHRLRSGMLPACVSTCVGGAMYFGDGNDPNSLVSELMRDNRVGLLAKPADTGSSPTPGTAAPTTTATATSAGTGGVAGVADVAAAQGTDPNVVYIVPEIPGEAMSGLKSCTPCHKMNVK